MPSQDPRTRALCACLALATLTLSARASAEPSEDERQAARAAMAAGRQARDKGDLSAALRSFTQANDVMHVPTTALEVAQTEIALGSLVEADATLQRVASMPVAMGEPEAFIKARTSAVALEHDLGERIPRLSFRALPASLNAAPGNSVELSVDGVPLDARAWSDGYRVNPGHHVLVATSGEVRLDKTADVAERGSELVEFDFSAPRANGGNAALNRQNSGRRAASPEPSLKTYAVYGLSGLAAASAGAGLTLGLVGKSRKHSLQNECAPNCAPDRVDRVRSMYTAANVAFALSASSAIAAVILYAVGPSTANAESATRRAPPTLAVNVDASGDAARVTVHGSF